MAKLRRRFRPEFKAEIVKLITDARKTVPDVCKAHELFESSVYGWLRQAKVDNGEGRPGEVTTAEKVELTDLRREVRGAGRNHSRQRHQCGARTAKPPPPKEDT